MTSGETVNSSQHPAGLAQFRAQAQAVALLDRLDPPAVDDVADLQRPAVGTPAVGADAAEELVGPAAQRPQRRAGRTSRRRRRRPSTTAHSAAGWASLGSSALHR